MWFARQNIALPIERLLHYILEHHEALQLSTLNLLRLNYALEAVRSLPSFIEIPQVVISISHPSSTDFILTFNSNEIIADYAGSLYTEGAGCDGISGQYFNLNFLNIEDFDYCAYSIENTIEEYINSISLAEPNIQITGDDIKWISKGLPSVASVVRAEEEIEHLGITELEKEEEIEKQALLSQHGASKGNPRYLLLWCFSRYLTLSQVKTVIADLGKPGAKSGRKFIEAFLKHVDIELLRTNPVAWQDIWIYNYIKYDFKGKITRNKLLSKYEKELMNT